MDHHRRDHSQSVLRQLIHGIQATGSIVKQATTQCIGAQSAFFLPKLIVGFMREIVHGPLPSSHWSHQRCQWIHYTCHGINHVFLPVTSGLKRS